MSLLFPEADGLRCQYQPWSRIQLGVHLPTINPNPRGKYYSLVSVPREVGREYHVVGEVASGSVALVEQANHDFMLPTCDGCKADVGSPSRHASDGRCIHIRVPPIGCVTCLAD